MRRISAYSDFVSSEKYLHLQYFDNPLGSGRAQASSIAVQFANNTEYAPQYWRWRSGQRCQAFRRDDSPATDVEARSYVACETGTINAAADVCEQMLSVSQVLSSGCVTTWETMPPYEQNNGDMLILHASRKGVPVLPALLRESTCHHCLLAQCL